MSVPERRAIGGNTGYSDGKKKLTPEVMEKTYELAKKGASNITIAKVIGVHPTTFSDWLRIGRERWEGAERLYDWADEIERIRGEIEASLSEKVIEAGVSGVANTWQAAMTFLERRQPAEWGKRDRLEVEGEKPQQVNVLVVNDADARELSRGLLARLTSGRTDQSLSIGAGDEPAEVIDGESSRSE